MKRIYKKKGELCMYKLVAIDLDGTLLNSYGEVSENTKEEIKKAIENGFNNYTSQEDMLSIFTKLFNKDILNDKLCDKAIEILYNQRCQDQVMRYIYQHVKYAHKTGYLDYLNHDVGVMNINNKYFYIGISVYNSKNIKGNKRLIGNLGRTIYEYLK